MRMQLHEFTSLQFREEWMTYVNASNLSWSGTSKQASQQGYTRACQTNTASESALFRQCREILVKTTMVWNSHRNYQIGREGLRIPQKYDTCTKKGERTHIKKRVDVFVCVCVCCGYLLSWKLTYQCLLETKAREWPGWRPSHELYTAVAQFGKQKTKAEPG